MAQYSSRQFHILSTHCEVAAVMAKGVFVLARVIFQRYSMTTGAVFHEKALHGGYKEQDRDGLGHLLIYLLATFTHLLAMHC